MFDVFTYSAATAWRDLAMYAIRMPDFFPRLAGTSLPANVQSRLNALLERRGGELLDGQTGLIADIAGMARKYPGPPIYPPFETSPNTRPEGVAAIVLAWLFIVAPEDMRTYAPVVENALQARLASYDIYEASIVDSLNRQMSSLMHALGLGQHGALKASALSTVCGRALRDWNCG